MSNLDLMLALTFYLKSLVFLSLRSTTTTSERQMLVESPDGRPVVVTLKSCLSIRFAHCPEPLVE
jgi:hypothetical protein